MMHKCKVSMLQYNKVNVSKEYVWQTWSIIFCRKVVADVMIKMWRDSLDLLPFLKFFVWLPYVRIVYEDTSLSWLCPFYRWLVVKDPFVLYVRPRHKQVGKVIFYDKMNTREAGLHHRVTIENLQAGVCSYHIYILLWWHSHTLLTILLQRLAVWCVLYLSMHA